MSLLKRFNSNWINGGKTTDYKGWHMKKAFTAVLLIFSIACLMSCSGKKAKIIEETYDSIYHANSVGKFWRG